MTSTAYVCVKIPKEYIDFLRKSESLYDDLDTFKLENTGKLPPTRKIIRVLIKNHLTIRGFIK